MNIQTKIKTPLIPELFEKYETQARTYCRTFNNILTTGKGCYLYDNQNREYLDFLSCAGALNYGHNHPVLKAKQIEYITNDGIQGALDFHTEVKAEFINTFQQHILNPRDMAYKMQFTSPTGTSVVESAVKLARKVTKRSKLVSFTNAFHGMSSTALGLTGNRHHRQPDADANVFRMPYENYMENLDSLAYFEQLLIDKSSGIDIPAAVIVETIQGEGGINVASKQWLRRLREITHKHDILLIIDDIQAGCGRTGRFFSFEPAGICPDMICLSKSLSGYGYPMSILLMAEHLDLWMPGEDNGTFRGNSLAMVTATAAINEFWCDDSLVNHMQNNEVVFKDALAKMCENYDHLIREYRGRGMMWGLEFYDNNNVAHIIDLCKQNNLIVESCGNENMVIKMFPAINIDVKDLKKGLAVIDQCIGLVSEIKRQKVMHNGSELG